MATIPEPSSGEDQRGQDLVEKSQSNTQSGSDSYASKVNAGVAKLDEKEKASKSGGGSNTNSGRMGQALRSTGQFMGRNKGKFAAGGGIAGLILALFFSFLALLPYKLESMMKNILEKRVEQYSERAVEARTEKITETFAEKSLLAGAEGDAAADAAFDKLVVSTGNLSSDVYKTWRLRKFATQLKDAEGITFQKGSKFGTVDYIKDGKLVGNIGSADGRRTINQAIRDQTKWNQFLKRAHLRKWARNALGIQKWKFFSGESDADKANTEVRGGLVDAAAAEDAIQIPKTLGEALGEDSSDNQSDGSLTDAVQGADQAGADAIKAAPKGLTAKALQKVFGDAIGKQISTVLAKVSGPLLILGLVDAAARFDHYLSTGAADASITQMHKAEYEAQFFQYLIIDDQHKNGTTPDGKKVTGSEFGAVMNQIGDASHSCGFQQLYANQDVKNCQDITTRNDGSTSNVGRSMNATSQPIKNGYSLFATDIRNPAGGTVHAILVAWYNTGRHVMDVVNAITGPIFSAIESIIPGLSWLMGQISGWLTDLIKDLFFGAVTGVETDGDLFNNVDAGGSGTGQDFMQSIGGSKITVAQAQGINQEIADQQAVQDSKLSWVTRVFSPDYNDSVVNKLAMMAPSSLPDATQQTMSYMASIFANPVQWLGGVLAVVPIPGVQTAHADGPLKDLYGPQHYDFTDPQLNQPIDTANLDTASQNAATRTGKPVVDITPDDVTPADCPSTGDNASLCILDLTALQTLYANSTTTDNGGIGDGN